jgi:hypothetical protein
LDPAQAAEVGEAFRASIDSLRSRIGEDAVDYLLNDDRSTAPVTRSPTTDDERTSAIGALFRATEQAVDEIAAKKADEHSAELRKALEEATRELDSHRRQLDIANHELKVTRAAAEELKRVLATRVWRWSAPARSIFARLRRRR